jgi:hypothetical protein
VAFWVVLSLAMLLRIARSALMRSYLSAGLFAGVATGTKYPAAALAVGILAAHLSTCVRAGRSVLRALVDARIILAGIIMAASFFCVSPYVVLDWAQTARLCPSTSIRPVRNVRSRLWVAVAIFACNG